MERTAFEFDELNTLRRYVTLLGSTLEAFKQTTAKELEDSYIDVLILEYLFGLDDASKQLDVKRITPELDSPDEYGEIVIESLPDEVLQDMYNAIYKEIDGKDFTDRIREHFDAEDVNGLLTVLETESGRDYNTGVFDRGKNAVKDGEIPDAYKRWKTMEDDRVRDTHIPLNDMVIPLSDEFVTYNDHHAMYPRAFGIAEEDCNCRCYISLERAVEGTT